MEKLSKCFFMVIFIILIIIGILLFISILYNNYAPNNVYVKNESFQSSSNMETPNIPLNTDNSILYNNSNNVNNMNASSGPSSILSNNFPTSNLFSGLSPAAMGPTGIAGVSNGAIGTMGTTGINSRVATEAISTPLSTIVPNTSTNINTGTNINVPN